MNTKKKSTLVVLGLVALLLAFATTTAWAQGPPKDSLTVTAKTSIGGVSPTSTGAPPQWFYAYCLPSGSSFVDTLPVDFTVTDNPRTDPGQSYTMHLWPAGSPVIGDSTTLPDDFLISDDGVTLTKNISINTDPLPDGNYHLNIQFDTDPNGKLVLSHHTIHIQVFVGEACAPGGGSCFLTDSDFNFLTDCSGADVTTSSGGTFAIVANAKGRIVATNPGQFYYNLIWTNPGGSQPVTINLWAVNLSPKGANSVHALTFNTTGFTQDASSFDMVNEDGTPCGPSGPCTITVGTGETLWVTWHLDYAQIGSPAAGIPLKDAVCPGGSCSSGARNFISATGTVTPSGGGSSLSSCTASACGYLKPN